MTFEIPCSIPGQVHFSFSLYYLPTMKPLKSNIYFFNSCRKCHNFSVDFLFSLILVNLLIKYSFKWAYSLITGNKSVINLRLETVQAINTSLSFSCEVHAHSNLITLVKWLTSSPSVFFSDNFQKF